MKTISALLVLVLTVISAAAVAIASDIGSLAWDQANIATLRSCSKTDLVTFLNGQWPGSFNSSDIGQFRWADLAGSGQYQLVLTLSGPCAHFVAVYNRGASGKLAIVQRLAGWADLKTGIRDLNGDGKDELIIEKSLVELSCADNVTWPAVYRFENGKYVEASRDFPSFYDHEMLPKINASISRYEAEGEQPNSKRVSWLIIERDKILRVIGQNPTAGLRQAYQWMNTDDPSLLLAATVTFNDIPGHGEEAKAARAGYDRALCERHPAMVSCRRKPPNP